MDNQNLIQQLRLRGDELSLQAAQRLEDSLSITGTPENVVKTICERRQISQDELRRKSRKSVETRCEIVKILREKYNLRLKNIAPLLGVTMSSVSRNYKAINFKKQ